MMPGPNKPIDDKHFAALDKKALRVISGNGFTYGSLEHAGSSR